MTNQTLLFPSSTGEVDLYGPHRRGEPGSLWTKTGYRRCQHCHVKRPLAQFTMRNARGKLSGVCDACHAGKPALRRRDRREPVDRGPTPPRPAKRERTPLTEEQMRRIPVFAPLLEEANIVDVRVEDQPTGVRVEYVTVDERDIDHPITIRFSPCTVCGQQTGIEKDGRFLCVDHWRERLG